MSTIDHAMSILQAIKDGKKIEFRSRSGNGKWSERASREVCDFVNFEYRIKPEATWTIVFARNGKPADISWTAPTLDRAIELSTDANTRGRNLLYVLKVEGDVVTKQKTPQ